VKRNGKINVNLAGVVTPTVLGRDLKQIKGRVWNTTLAAQWQKRIPTQTHVLLPLLITHSLLRAKALF